LINSMPKLDPEYDHQLFPEAQAVFWAFNSKFDWIEDGIPDDLPDDDDDRDHPSLTAAERNPSMK